MHHGAFLSSRRFSACLFSSEKKTWSWRGSGVSRIMRRTRRSRGCAQPWRKGSAGRPPELYFAPPWLRKRISCVINWVQRWRCARNCWSGWRKTRTERETWKMRVCVKRRRRCEAFLPLVSHFFKMYQVEWSLNHCSSVVTYFTV